MTVFFVAFQVKCSPDLTEEEQIELCLKVPCKVELFHSNVCKGVEKGWPKRMFNKATFDRLNPKEKRCIYRSMVKKAMFLYETYVDEKRLADRCRRRTSRALAPYYELQYRKNLFERINALGKDQPAPGYDATIDQSIALTDSEADEDEAEEFQDISQNLSLETVINTGKTGTQKSNVAAEQTDLSDADCHSDVMSENTEYRNAKRTTSNWTSKTTYTITQNISDDDIIASEYEITSTSNHEYNIEMSESISATPSRDYNSEVESQHGENFNRSNAIFSELVLMTPMVKRASQRRNEIPDGNTDEEGYSEADSLDFFTQEMEGRTSTQQQRQQ